MSRSVIPRIRPRRRTTVLASACVALAAVGALTLTGTASAAPGAATGTKPSCSNATLNGTYTFGYISWQIAKGKSTPASEAGFDTFNGKGTSTGVITAVYNGVVAGSNTPDTSTYTINADCIGTIVFHAAGRRRADLPGRLRQQEGPRAARAIAAVSLRGPGGAAPVGHAGAP